MVASFIAHHSYTYSYIFSWRTPCNHSSRVMVASVVQLALLVINVECIAFGRDAFYIYMESPARADVWRSLKLSDFSLFSVLLLYSPFFLSTVFSYSYLLSASLSPRLDFGRLVDAQRLYSKNASSEVMRFFPFWTCLRTAFGPRKWKRRARRIGVCAVFAPRNIRYSTFPNSV